MSSRRPCASLLCVGLLVACAQSVQGPEASPLLCDNDTDDDRDGLPDCDDPDCWAFALCELRRSAPVSEPEAPPLSDVPQEPVDGPQTDPFAPTWDQGDAVDPPLDAGGSLDATMPEPDAASAPFTDASCGCDGGCEACPDATDEALGRFEITSIAISVPRAVSEDRCLDPGDTCVLDRPSAEFVRCRCAPDPRVVVYVDDAELGTTNTRQGADTATWTLPGLELDLYDGARLGFEVLESDEGESGNGAIDGSDAGPAAMEHVFDCEVIATAAGLEAGNLQCGKRFRTDSGAEANFNVRVRLRKLAGNADP